MPQVNLVAVLVAAIVNMVLGFLWYGPLFGKIWMKAMGYTQKDAEKMKKEGNMGKIYGLAFIGGLVMAYVLAAFIGLIGANTAAAGAQVGFWAWLGFIVTKSFTDVLFEGKNWTAYYLSMGYQLVSLLAMGAILASWL